MKTLIEQLTEQTQDLRAEFVNQTITWAKNQYNTVSARVSWNEVDWCNYLGLTPEVKNARTSIQFQGFPSGFYNTKAARVLDRMKNEARGLKNVGFEKFIAIQIKAAEDHYVNSVKKLAFRLNKKGVVDGSDFTITKARVGVNLEITIKHDGKVTKAWTIVAEGAIQRPHYRYLVK